MSIVENGFELAGLTKYVDFINIMTFDYNVPNTNSTLLSGYTGPSQPLYAPVSASGKIPQWNINQTINGKYCFCFVCFVFVFLCFCFCFCLVYSRVHLYILAHC